MTTNYWEVEMTHESVHSLYVFSAMRRRSGSLDLARNAEVDLNVETPGPQEGQEVGDRLQGEAQALLECALAAPATLAIDGMRVDRLCSLVAQLLGHGLTGRAAPPPTWLPSWQASKPSVLEMLQVGSLGIEYPWGRAGRASLQLDWHAERCLHLLECLSSEPSILHCSVV